jgi:hypothetical protein
MAQDGKDQLERPGWQGGQASPPVGLKLRELTNREYGNVPIDLLDQKLVLIVRYLAIWQWTGQDKRADDQRYISWHYSIILRNQFRLSLSSNTDHQWKLLLLVCYVHLVIVGCMLMR